MIDEQILRNYRLSDANYIAADMLREKGESLDPALDAVIKGKIISEEVRETFFERISKLQPALMKHLLFGYANPLINKLKSDIEL